MVLIVCSLECDACQFHTENSTIRLLKITNNNNNFWHYLYITVELLLQTDVMTQLIEKCNLVPPKTFFPAHAYCIVVVTIKWDYCPYRKLFFYLKNKIIYPICLFLL